MGRQGRAASRPRRRRLVRGHRRPRLTSSDGRSLSPVLMVTLGERGARLHTQGVWHDVPPFPARRGRPDRRGRRVRGRLRRQIPRVPRPPQSRPLRLSRRQPLRPRPLHLRNPNPSRNRTPPLAQPSFPLRREPTAQAVVPTQAGPQPNRSSPAGCTPRRPWQRTPCNPQTVIPAEAGTHPRRGASPEREARAWAFGRSYLLEGPPPPPYN